MRVGDDGGGAVADHRAGKFGGGDHAAFQVNMGIDEAGGDEPSADIDLLYAAVAADAGNQPIGNGNIAVAEIIAEHIEIGGVFEYHIGGFFAPRHTDEAELAV